MPHKPPLSPRLSIYHWHPAMLASILHRASGLLLALSLPLYLYLLYDMSLNAEQFKLGMAWLQQTPLSLILWLMGTALLYHLCNGVRFILQDIGILQQRKALRASAQGVLALATLGSFLLGSYLW